MALGPRAATNFNRNRLKLGAVFLQQLQRDSGDQGSGALGRVLGEQSEAGADGQPLRIAMHRAGRAAGKAMVARLISRERFSKLLPGLQGYSPKPTT